MRAAALVAVGLSLFSLQGYAAPPNAELIFFTDDGSASGTPLRPGFLLHSIWSGLGGTTEGQIYIAVSNHLQPGGNVALFHYDPAQDRVRLLGDIRSISTAANNWMAQESQYKVHSFLMQHADGKIYFASDDHDLSPFLRGAHLYQIDPLTDQVVDYSKTQPFLMTRALGVIANSGQPEEASGVFIEYYGIKGIGLNARVPDLLYAMTFPDGHLIEYDLADGSMAKVGESSSVGYVFYVDNQGNAYYSVSDPNGQEIRKYNRTTGNTRTLATGLPEGEPGMIAPNQAGDEVYVLIAQSKNIYRLKPDTDEFTFFMRACGSNFWRLYNLTLSPDEQSLYYVSNNNTRSNIRRIDIATKTCTEVIDIDSLLGSRNLCFGGIHVWDQSGSFYAPVWTNGEDPPDVALLKVSVEDPQPEICGDVDHSNRLDDEDVTKYRLHLADPDGQPFSPLSATKCNVIAPPRPCDVLDVTVLRRAISHPPQPLGPVQICPAAF